MPVWPLVAATVASLAVVCYAHYEIPGFTRGFAKRALAHGVLIAVGLAFGAAIASTPQLPAPRWFSFVAAFGTVHVPAAAILALKRLRGSGRS